MSQAWKELGPESITKPLAKFCWMKCWNRLLIPPFNIIQQPCNSFNKVEWMLKPFARVFTIKTIEREKGFHTCRYFKINFTWRKKWIWINYKSASIGLTSALRPFFARWPMHKQSNVSLHCDVCVYVVLEVVMSLWCHVTTWRQFKWACIQCVIQYYSVLCIQRYQRLRWSSILGSSACIWDSRRHNM